MNGLTNERTKMLYFFAFICAREVFKTTHTIKVFETCIYKIKKQSQHYLKHGAIKRGILG